jgi:hypothetical protein
MLPANEVGLLAGKKRDAYGPIRELLYNLSEGRERSRHSASNFASSARAARFRTIFVATSEHSFSEYAAFAGETRDEGEYARCLDVPASGQTRATIMDRAPEEDDKELSRRWASRQIIEIRKACEEHRGMVFRPYIKYLIKQVDTLKETVTQLMEEFQNSIADMEVEGALEHAARNMALVYAGGRLAIDAKLLPWSKGGLLTAVRECFERAIALVRENETALERAKVRLRKRLRKKTIVERTIWSRFSEDDHPGFYEYRKGKRRRYTIYSQAFRDWFGTDQAAFRAVLIWLEEESLLHVKATRKTYDTNALERVQQTPKWPNKKSVRSIVFDDPFPKK